MTKSVHDLPDNWKETMLGLYSQGASDTEVRSELGMTAKLWHMLLLTDTSFEDVVHYGKTLCLAWWMKQGRLNLDNKAFNAQLYNINMQNRFNWSSKGSTIGETDDDDYESEEAIDEQIKALTKQDAAASH